MQINLRKANAVQSEIKKALSGVRLEASVTVTEFTEDVEGTINKGNADLNAALQQKRRLIGALFEIRSAVGRANAGAGIGDTLTAIEQIDQEMSVVSALTGLKARTALTEINARIEKAKANTNERMSLYGDRLSAVETTVVDQATVDSAKAEVKQMKRAKQALQDKLLQLNVNTLIELSAETAATLKDEGIL
jgi:uncharacterized protein YdcH (DUF465 family)